MPDSASQIGSAKRLLPVEKSSASGGRVLQMPARIEPVEIDELRFQAQQLLKLRDIEHEIHFDIANKSAEINDLQRQLSRVEKLYHSINGKIDDMLERLGRGAQTA